MSNIELKVSNTKILQLLKKIEKNIENIEEINKELINNNNDNIKQITEIKLNNIDYYKLWFKNKKNLNLLLELTKTFHDNIYNLENKYIKYINNLEKSHQEYIIEIKRVFEQKEINNANELFEKNGYKIITINEYNNMIKEIENLKLNNIGYDNNLKNKMLEEFKDYYNESESNTANLDEEALHTRKLISQMLKGDMKAYIEYLEEELKEAKEEVKRYIYGFYICDGI